MPSVALLTIATGRYKEFIPALLNSLQRFFQPAAERSVFVFTDDQNAIPALPFNGAVFHTDHMPWPAVTLFRYRTFLSAEHVLSFQDYLFYCDADMLLERPVGNEILAPGLVPTLHPGYQYSTPTCLPFERRPESSAYVSRGQGVNYFCGGFQGGSTDHYLKACRAIDAMIQSDSSQDIIAEWHDESYWNRYLIDNPPAKVLPALYCSPQSWNVPMRRIVALDKDHAAYR